MKKHWQTIITVFIMILLAAWVGRSYIRNLFPPKMKFAAEVLTMIDSNEAMTINDFKGQVLVVSCYQTWCTDCARETPVLNQLATNIHSEKFKVIYISDEAGEKVDRFRQRFASDKLLFAHSATSMGSLGIRSYPTTFLVNKKGEVIITKLEGYDWLKEEAAIQKLIAE